MAPSSLSRVVVAGSSGLIGRALVDDLRRDGVDVVRLVRREAHGRDEVRWLDRPHLDPSVLEGADAVVDLCGASVGRLPWTRAYRRELFSSRLGPAHVLSAALARLREDRSSPPPLLVSASASGFYGSAPGRVLTESAPAGDTLLARLCVAWEDAARAAGDRVALLRTSPVVHPGAFLKPLLPLTRLGLAGPIGSGRQSWAWISLADEVAAIRHVLENRITGPVNLAGPEPATAADIGRALARRLRRPFLLPAPAGALRLALGRDFAESMLLADARVDPAVLRSTGFSFSHPTVDDAIAAVVPAR